MKSRQIALCGLLCALAEVCLLLGGLIPLATFCAPLLAMAALLPILCEYGLRPAAAAYGAVALLSLMLVPDRETALVYVFFGWYPLLRPRIARLSSRLLRVVCRLGVFAGAAWALYGLTLALLAPELAESGGSRLLNLALLALGGGTFLLLDLALERLTVLWQRRLRRRFFP